MDEVNEQIESLATDETAEMPVPVDEGQTEAAPGAPAAASLSVKQKEPQVPLPSSLQEIVGALLFASESPLTPADLRECVRGVAPAEGESAEVMEVYRTCTTREIDQALRGLEKELERAGCGFRLVCAGGTYRLQTVPSCGRYVRALLHLDRPNRLSRAALETLAIIAYRQPITKAEIEQIRGVAVDAIVKTLVDLQLVRLVGRSELPGHPFLYGTTPLFLKHFGLASLSDLNALDPTLQRSNPRERAKLFVKKEKPASAPLLEPESTADKAPDAQPASEEAAETETPAEKTDETDAAEELVHVSFAQEEDDEEDVFIDETPDEFDDEDDEDEFDDEDDEDEFDEDEDDEDFEDEDEDDDEDDEEEDDADDDEE